MNIRSAALVLTMLLTIAELNGAERPRLIVFISIDQMRADHLVRYAREYDGGFKTLLTEGVVYANATLNYSGSATGPGHATLGTGVYPWKSGIVGNNYIDRSTNKKTYCVEDSAVSPVDGGGGYRSPANLLATGIGDWLKAASPASKVISISFKDRAAILMGGKRANAAYWFNRAAGSMTTSSYYMTHLPSWAAAFNGKDWIGSNVPVVWKKIAPDSVYDAYGPDAFEGEALWDGKTTFPHVFDPSKKAGQTFDSPYGNLMLLDYARAAMEGEQLGKRNVTDLLCISLSPTDNIGSNFGPNSQEMLDNLIRLDRALGSFMAELVRSYGREKVVVVLSGDHGVMPLPEYTTKIAHRAARRIDMADSDSDKLRELDSALRATYKTGARLLRSGSINYAALTQAGANIALVERQIRAALVSVDGIADVYFRTELADSTSPQRPYLDAFRHSYLAARSPDYLIRYCEDCLVTDAHEGTSHGSPYLYDTHVPIIFWGQQLPARTISRSVHTVDIVATLAALLNIPHPDGLDGVPLEEVHSR